MKIDINTKYNIGDVLYYANLYNSCIKKLTVKNINVIYKENEHYINYNFCETNDCVNEENMFNYVNTPEKAAQLIMNNILNNFNKS